MLDHFHAGDEVELPFELLHVANTIVDCEPQRARMPAGNVNHLGRCVDARHLGAHPSERLGQKPGSAADIDRRLPLERGTAALVALPVLVDLVADIFQPDRVQFVEHRGSAIRVPPFISEPAEALCLFGNDACLDHARLLTVRDPGPKEPFLPRIVMKFGGTSMAGIERIRSVSERVRREAHAGNQVLVVVSAMAGETDRLVQLCREAAPLHNPTEYDVVVASGEQVTSGLLAMTLQAMGLKARSFMGWQLVRASGVHGNARVEAIESALLDEALSNGTVAVIPGFQGVSTDGRLATLGRGGSDTSAVAIAAGVKADRCDIYTDVDGVYTTDPRIVPRARKLTQVTFEEMLELAGVGAKVLQVRSVGLAMRENLPLRVLSAFEDKPGTDIVAELSGDQMERNLIAGIAADRNEARITLTRVPDKPGTVAQVIGPIAEAGIQVDMIVHAATPDTGSSDLTFTVPRASLAQAMAVIEQRKAEIGYDQLVSDDAVAKVSIVGVGIRSNPLLAAKMFEVLADRQINLHAVSASEIKVSALIAERELELAVRVLHAAFGLDAGQGA